MSKTDKRPQAFEADNLSLGWAKILNHLAKPGITQINPLTLVITGFGEIGQPDEIPEIRQAVDAFLAAEGKRDSENIAWTIFPQRYLEIAGGDRNAFFELFIESFPRVQTFNPRNNKRGSYFQRLVDLNGDGSGPNQLKWMIDEYHQHPDSRRTSKFQATTFDPSRDHSSTSLLEFPCLQQVSFTFDSDELALNAFYATQQIARKGYGNYLGLARLGAFMAKEMDLRFAKMSVFVGSARMDTGKNDPNLQPLLQVVRKYVLQGEALAAA